MADYLSLNEEALIQRCQEKNIPYEGKSVTELRVLLIQSCTEKAPGAAEMSVPWEVQLRREEMALEREKMQMEMEAREAKEKRELEHARMEHEREKLQMELEKAKLEAEVKIQQQKQRSESASLQSSEVTPEEFKPFPPRDDPHTSLNTSEKEDRNWEGEDSMRSTEPSQTMALASTSIKESIKKDLSEMTVSLGQRSLPDIIANAEKELKLLKNAKLDIAFTGASGAGKSSLVNAFRNIPDYDKDAARPGVNQATMDPVKYPYPQFPNLTLWDLPGIGTPEFHPRKYLEKVNFSRYDFFIIVAAERFTVNDTMLASEIQKMNKRFYFVRTKVDQAMDAERRNPDFSEEKTLEEIKKYCVSNLIEVAGNPKVFLISSWHLDLYDFKDLQKTLKNDLNEIKRPLLTMAMPAFSREELQEKKAAMEAGVWKKALNSCFIGLIPVPGVARYFNIGRLVTILKDYCKAFGLDEDLLQNLANRVRKPIVVLRSAVKTTRLANQITPEYVEFLIAASKSGGEEILDFIPVLGSLFGRANSFATTFYLLKSFLEDAMKDAENVLAKVLE